jgi:hypothetical protein
MKLVVLVLATLCFAGMSIEAVSTELVGEAWRTHHSIFSCDELITASDLAGDCVLCHDAEFNLNPYAVDIKTEYDADDILWPIAIQRTNDYDSDGDGVTNVVEIREDCTFPGDPLSVPVTQYSWSRIMALYR